MHYQFDAHPVPLQHLHFIIHAGETLPHPVGQWLSNLSFIYF